MDNEELWHDHGPYPAARSYTEVNCLRRSERGELRTFRGRVGHPDPFRTMQQLVGGFAPVFAFFRLKSMLVVRALAVVHWLPW
jgi:hypothetical protein